MEIKQLPISIIVLTQNEEANIAQCLKSLIQYFDDIWVIDSYSQDKTVLIAKQYGVQILQNNFIDYATQRNWALKNANLKYDWLCYIDADEQVTHEFCHELFSKLSSASSEIAGMTVTVDFFFLGRKLRFARPHVPMLRVLRLGRVQWDTIGSREFGIVQGKIIPLNQKLLHWDKKPIKDWIYKQVKNALLESQINTFSVKSACKKKSEPDEQTRERFWRFWLRSNVWARLPRFWRTFFYFFYRYLINGGILDGKAGLAYCFLHALWLPFLIDLFIEEKKLMKSTETLLN